MRKIKEVLLLRLELGSTASGSQNSLPFSKRGSAKKIPQIQA
jgi:hypothetical protein